MDVKSGAEIFNLDLDLVCKLEDAFREGKWDRAEVAALCAPKKMARARELVRGVQWCNCGKPANTENADLSRRRFE